MNIALLLPAALSALAALLLPLLIHLARRNEEKRITFAALRWLREKPKPRQRLRFDEWPLLILRLLLLALIALWLAKPVLTGTTANKSWVVVMPGVSAEQARGFADNRKTEWHWLAPGFPPLDTTAPTGNIPFASLLRELDSQLPANTNLTVIVPERLQGADAQRPQLTRAAHWQTVAGAMPVGEIAKPATLKLDLSQVDATVAGLRYLRAVAAAWQPVTGAQTVRVWLSAAPMPNDLQQWIREGGTALTGADAAPASLIFTPTTWRDEQGNALMETARWGNGRVLRFTRALSPAQMPQLLSADFPQRLRDVLQGPHDEPARVMAQDYAPHAGATPYPQSPQSLQHWLALLIAVLFLIERWLATGKRRGVA